MRALLIVSLLAGSGLRMCGEEEQADAPPPPLPPTVSAEAEVEVAPELMEARHGGEVVVVHDHVVEVVPTAEGEVYGYVAAADGTVPEPAEVQLTVHVHVAAGGVRPVILAWNPTELRFEGRLEGTVPAPGSVEVLLSVHGRPRTARVHHVVVVPRAKVKLIARGAPPGATVWLHVPPGHVRVKGHVPPGHAKGRAKGHVRVHGPKPPKANVRVDVHAPPPPTVRAEVRVQAPQPPPPPRAEVRAGVRVEGGAGVRVK